MQVKKSFGTFPEDIGVLDTIVSFNEEGIAEVTEEGIVNVLTQIPGYEVIGETTSEDEDKEDFEDQEDPTEATEEQEAPKAKPAPKRKPGIKK